jgi:hypothetical protein
MSACGDFAATTADGVKRKLKSWIPTLPADDCLTCKLRQDLQNWREMRRDALMQRLTIGADSVFLQRVC